jgi:Zinc finger, ZZ type
VFLQPIQDPDPFINCELMDGRDAFLTMARDRHYEFSSLRRAKYSTMSMLYELHNQGQDRFVYTCNNCKNHVETRWHCTVCDVSFSHLILPDGFVTFSFHRTLTFAPIAMREIATSTRWRSSALTLTMAPLQEIKDRPIHRYQLLSSIVWVGV